MGRIRRHLTYANIVATLALFLVLGGGTALASYVISSNSQVGPGTISGHHPPSGDHANIIGGSVNGNDLSSGAVTTAKLANQAVTSAKMAPSALGARAYGEVTGSTTVTRSKNVAGVSNPGSGVFCIALAGGINASKTGLVATPDYSHDSTTFGTNTRQTIAEWAADAGDCPAGRLEVLTGYIQASTGGSSDNDVRTVNSTQTDEAFFFVVP